MVVVSLLFGVMGSQTHFYPVFKVKSSLVDSYGLEYHIMS